MDDKKFTTRKGFMQKAGLAIAGVFTLTAASRSATRNAGTSARIESSANPFDRIRPAQGTVHRKI
jgi:hypothetical protein